MNEDYSLGYKKGKAFVRDNIIAMLIGFQGDVGFDEDSETYQAYQKVMDNIEIRFGEFMKPII